MPRPPKGVGGGGPGQAAGPAHRRGNSVDFQNCEGSPHMPVTNVTSNGTGPGGDPNMMGPGGVLGGVIQQYAQALSPKAAAQQAANGMGGGGAFSSPIGVPSPN